MAEAIDYTRGTLGRRRAVKLLVSPVPLPDECSVGHLQRVAVENGLCNPSTKTLAEICQALRDRGTLGHQMTFGELLRPPRQRAAIAGAQVPHWALVGARALAPAVCPACLDKASYLRAAWSLRGFDCCPIHDKPLAVALAKHGRGARVDEILRGVVSNWKDKGKSFTSDEFELGRAIWSNASVAAEVEGPSAFAFPIFIVHLLSNLAGTQGRSRVREGPPRVLARASSWLRSEGFRLDGSRDNVPHLLGQLRSGNQRYVAARVLSDLVEAESQEATILSLLPLREWLAMLGVQGFEYLRLRKRDADPVGQVLGEKVPLEQIARERGIPDSRLRAALVDEGVEPVQVIDMIRRTRLYSAADADRVLREAGAGIPSREVGAMLGMTNHRHNLRQLRWGRVISYFGSRHQAYEAAAVHSLLRNLDSVAFIGKPVATHEIALADSSLYLKANRHALAELFTDLSAGRIPIRRDRSGTGLAAFRVPLDTLARLRNRSRAFAWHREVPNQLGLFDASPTIEAR